jgi:hypothetical protein
MENLALLACRGIGIVKEPCSPCLHTTGLADASRTFSVVPDGIAGRARYTRNNRVLNTHIILLPLYY